MSFRCGGGGGDDLIFSFVFVDLRLQILGRSVNLPLESRVAYCVSRSQ